MLYEYALEPTLLTQPSACRLMVNSMGFSKGRLVSQFPEHWESLVHVILADPDMMPMAKKSILVKLSQIKQSLFPRTCCWDDSQTWLNNVMQEHGVQPFRAILATSRPGNNKYILCEDDLDETNKLWKADTTVTINRDATEMASATRLLLESAKEVILVDPHFDPGLPRYRRPLERFLQILSNRSTSIPFRRFEYHTATDATSSYLEKVATQELCRMMPDDITLKIIVWQSHHELHNRYVLTNPGGISFHHGLDDGPGTDELSLLSRDSYINRWRQYQKCTSPFTFRIGLKVNQTGVEPIESVDWG